MPCTLNRPDAYILQMKTVMSNGMTIRTKYGVQGGHRLLMRHPRLQYSVFQHSSVFDFLPKVKT